MPTEIIVSEMLEPSVASQRFELAECKGVGHPDVLCDGIAERISHEYVRWCLVNTGSIPHHNFDKVLLIAGESEVSFGGGAVLRPIHVTVGGRATHVHDGRDIPVESIVHSATIAHLQESVRRLVPAEHCTIDCRVGRGHPQLQALVANNLANDTISCSAGWPRTNVEDIVYLTTRYLNDTVVTLAPIGEDVKVSAYRRDNRIQLVVAVPFIAGEIPHAAAYSESKHFVRDCVNQFASNLAGREVDVILNAADDTAVGRAYLTVTGTSAEMSDDGSVGRGNRASGFVAPLRPSSTPPCGKNPVSHPGKIYNVLAMRMARLLVEAVPDVAECRVFLLTTIGASLRQPSIINVAIRRTGAESNRAISGDIEAILESALTHLDDVLADLVAGPTRLY